MEWLLWLIIGGAVLFGCGRGCAWGYRRWRRMSGDAPRARLRSERQRSLGTAALEPMAAGGSTPSARARKPDAPEAAAGSRVRPESPLETLQRRFVEGEIDIEEYERELDRLYELEAPGASD